MGLNFKQLASMLSFPKGTITIHYKICHSGMFKPFLTSYTTSQNWFISQINRHKVFCQGRKCEICGYVETKKIFILDSTASEKDISQGKDEVNIPRAWININEDQNAKEFPMYNEEHKYIGRKFYFHE